MSPDAYRSELARSEGLALAATCAEISRVALGSPGDRQSAHSPGKDIGSATIRVAPIYVPQGLQLSCGSADHPSTDSVTAPHRKSP